MPDLSDTQVIVYSRWDRSPDIIEDQVTYPIVTALLGAPKVKAIRGFSDFGFSYVYVIFEDGTDVYWARSRDAGVPVQDPAAPARGRADRARARRHRRGLGLPVRAGRRQRERTRLAELRSYPGLVPALRPAERARAWPRWRRIGGFVRQYQVTVDPNRLPAYRLPLEKVVDAIRERNNDVGGRLVELSGARVHGARARLRAVDRRPREDRRQDRRERHAGAAAGHRPRRSSAPTSAAASPTSTAGATRSAASSSCATARTP